MANPTTLTVPLAATLAACAVQAPPVRAPITAQELTAHVRFLASDLLEGRGVGTRGDELARLYLATQLEGCGLRPGCAAGSWNQAVPILGITTTVTRTLAAEGPAGAAEFAAPGEFTAVAGSPAPAAAWQDAELVFVGYGIRAPEQQWDDFGDADLAGKVLLVMNDDPAGDPARFGGRTRLYYGRWTYKFEQAARCGAIGALVIHTDGSAGYPFHVVQGNHGRENCWLPFRDGEPTLAIRSWVTEATAKRLCALGGHDLDALRARAERGNQPPVPLGVRLDLEVANEVRELRSGNVVGLLPGGDPLRRDECVVVTAHFDHLGRGAPVDGDCVYNGAVDNATGCAGLLAIARACASLPVRPARSILFVGLTAEESGLLGAQFFTANPPVPPRRLVANFNLDSLNVFGRTRDVELVGHGKNSLTALAARLAAARGREVAPESSPQHGLFYRSDHYHFARIGVPTAYFTPGRDFLDRPEPRRRLRASYGATRYHRPTDELEPWWDLDGAVEDLELVLACVLATAETDAAPAWTPGDEFAPLR
ncbi:MAG: M28 family peptidase [Planctomycetes bacterium]|nr:M28 family peptidase [Planctomycetota bacterium]